MINRGKNSEFQSTEKGLISLIYKELFTTIRKRSTIYEDSSQKWK